MSELYFCGFNGFHQFQDAHTLKTNALTEFRNEYSNDDILYSFSWAFNVFAFGKEISVRGFIDQQPNNVKTFKTEHNIKKISSNDNICLVLLENGDLFNLNIRQRTLFKLNFIDVEKSCKRNIFGELKEENAQDTIEHIACGNLISIAITRNNIVYNIPSKIHQFPLHEKIKHVECGLEHVIALNSNGDVYTWGNGLRGQLGHPDLKSQEFPLLLDALAGIKIIAIAAGGWHSAAISAFGDIYIWGSNVNGQLGIEVFKRSDIGNEIVSPCLKNPTVYPLPQIIDLPICCRDEINNDQESSNCDPIKIICGSRHTFIQRSCGKVFCTGWNEHGQLGINSNINFKDNFIEIENLPKVPERILCGPWCTVIIC